MLRIDREVSHKDFTEEIKDSISNFNDSVINDLLGSKVVVLSDYNKGALLNCKS